MEFLTKIIFTIEFGALIWNIFAKYCKLRADQISDFRSASFFLCGCSHLLTDFLWNNIWQVLSANLCAGTSLDVEDMRKHFSLR